MKTISAGMLFLGFILLAFAGLFATTDPLRGDQTLPYLPPEPIHFLSLAGQAIGRPYILRQHPVPNRFGEYNSKDLVALSLRIFAFPPPYPGAGHAVGPLRLVGIQGEYPGDSPHFLGTDQYGRDVWSKLLYGGRTSIMIGLAAASIASLIALLLGLMAGLAGGVVDALLMRITEIMLSVPWFYLLLALRALLPLRTPPAYTVMISAGLLALIGWARPARILRGVALEARGRGYVVMSTAYGATRWHIARWHLLPDLYPQTLTQFSVLLPQFIASEVALSYLGLGVDEPFVTWGSMLTAAQQLSSISDYPWLLTPIVAMLLFFFAFHFLADHFDVTGCAKLFESIGKSKSR